MNAHSVVHSSFVVEWSFDRRPGEVFAAWADPSVKRQWFTGPDDWDEEDHVLDFRTGGREHAGEGRRVVCGTGTTRRTSTS